MTHPPEARYPLPRLPGRAGRVKHALVIDVHDVLVRHGYPAMDSGADLTRLYRALDRVPYGPDIALSGQEIDDPVTGEEC